MLESVKIKNFKSISSQSLELKELSSINTVIGGNNSGKTAILEVLWIVVEIIFKQHPDLINNLSQAVIRESNVNQGNVLGEIKKILLNLESMRDLVHLKGDSFEIEFGFNVRDSISNKLKDKYKNVFLDEVFSRGFRDKMGDLGDVKINYVFSVAKNACRVTSLMVGNMPLLRVDGNRTLFLNMDDVINSRLAKSGYNGSNGQPFYNDILFKELSSLLGKLKVYYIPSRRKITEKISSTDNNVGTKGEHLKRDLFKLYHGESTQISEYNEILTIFKDITGKAIRGKPFLSKDNHADIVFTEKNVDVNLENSGYGFNQLLSLIFNIIRSKSNLILIDEPEISLHPQSQIKFYESI